MNKSESKYFATAMRMDEAFLRLLEKKDFAYITVKELCETAGVNRSTFYLHYETMADLLSESAQYMNEQFLTYMNRNTETFVTKMKECPLDELYLVTQEYLTPYLNYIKEHQRLFRTAMEHYVILGIQGIKLRSAVSLDMRQYPVWLKSERMSPILPWENGYIRILVMRKMIQNEPGPLVDFQNIFLFRMGCTKNHGKWRMGVREYHHS